MGTRRVLHHPQRDSSPRCFGKGSCGDVSLVLPVFTYVLRQARFELLRCSSFGRVMSEWLDVHGQSGVAVAQDALICPRKPDFMQVGIGQRG